MADEPGYTDLEPGILAKWEPEYQRMLQALVESAAMHGAFVTVTMKVEIDGRPQGSAE